MKDDKRLDVKLSLVITDNEKPYSSATVTWEDVPYFGVLELEKKLIALLQDMNQFGESGIHRSSYERAPE